MTAPCPECARLRAPAVKPLTYLACPYSHPDRAVRVARFEAVNRASAVLMLAGHNVYSPISQCHPIGEAHSLPGHWEFWANFDRAFLSCSGRLVVLQLDGWKESVGVTAEIALAAEFGIPVKYASLKRLLEEGLA